MNLGSFEIFGLQVALSFIAYGIVAKWYVFPRVAALPLRDGLLPLVLAHPLRHVGLVVLVPVVTDPNLPRNWNVPLAYGDLAAQLLAVLAAFALRGGWAFAIPLIWIFNIVGTVDFLVAYVHGSILEVYKFNLNSVWYITTFIGPALLVVHFMIFALLIKRPK